MAHSTQWDNEPGYVITAVDAESLDILRYLVGGEFSSVVQRYLSDSENYIKQMDAAFKKASYNELYQLAHTLKGSSGTLSAHQLYDICSDLEQATLTPSSLSKIAHLLNAIETEFNHVKQALLHYLKISGIKKTTEQSQP